MMPEPTLAVSQPTTLDCLDAQGQGLRIEFQKQGDRFGHTIFSVRNDKAIPQLNSIEGTPDETAPSSPPFTELHQQGETIFLSGATTLGHWSMSVALVEGRLLFEVACRLKKEPSWLGSTYRVVAGNYLLEPEGVAEATLQQGMQLVTPSRSTDDQYPTTIQWRYSIREKSQ